MVKTDAAELKTGQSEVAENEEQVTPAEDESKVTGGKQMEEDNHVEEDPQMDVEVKGNTPTVKMSWEKNSGDGEDVHTGEISSSEPMAVEEKLENREENPEVTSSSVVADATETIPEQEVEGCGDEAGSQMDADQSAPTADVTCGNEDEQVKSGDPGKKTKKRKKKSVNETEVNGKQKSDSITDIYPSKKANLENAEFCLCVGNLNKLKTFAEVKDSLESFFMNQSFPCKEIRFTRSKKHAYISLASETDLATALTLDGEMILDQPMKVTKVNIIKRDQEKVCAPAPPREAGKNAQSLCVENLPVTTTKKRILKLFPKAVEVRFPGGKELPTRGKAFVEFPDKATAEKVLQRKGVMIKGQALTLSRLGEPKKAKDQNAEQPENVNTNTEAATLPNHTLHVGNLSNTVSENHLRKAFPKAVSVIIPQSKGKPKSFAFVQFETVEEAENAMNASQNLMICDKAAKVQFCDRPRPKDCKVLTKTLIVMGLAAKTTAETLQGAFEGASSARVTIDHLTGCSKGFGFVEFDSEESCKSAKAAMEDCLIDGKRVTVTNALSKEKEGQKGGKKECDKKGGGGAGEKRKADSAPKNTPPKKQKVINDGFCLFIGNLNASKSNEEIKDSLANYLTNQSLLFEDIRLDKSRKHAFVDLASEVDLNKALLLTGASILDKSVKISKAKVKGGTEAKVNAPPTPQEGLGAGKKKRGKKGKKGGNKQAETSPQDVGEEEKPDN